LGDVAELPQAAKINPVAITKAVLQKRMGANNHTWVMKPSDASAKSTAF
jgi:hypothetical protein